MVVVTYHPNAEFVWRCRCDHFRMEFAAPNKSSLCCWHVRYLSDVIPSCDLDQIIISRADSEGIIIILFYILIIFTVTDTTEYYDDLDDEPMLPNDSASEYRVLRQIIANAANNNTSSVTTRYIF